MRMMRRAGVIKKPKKWVQHTITVAPSGYINTLFTNETNVSNGYTDASSTSYASFRFKEDYLSRQELYYTFNLDAIPTDAVINSVTCQATTCVYQNTSTLSTLRVQMYSDTTAKGNSSSVTRTKTTFTLDVGTWTALELRQARVRMSGYKENDSSFYPRYYYFYGATLTVIYSVFE